MYKILVDKYLQGKFSFMSIHDGTAGTNHLRRRRMTIDVRPSLIGWKVDHRNAL